MEDNTTLRSVSSSIGISHQGLLNWAMEYGKNCKSPLEVSLELNPTWSGLLGVDGKELKIKGKDFTLLIAQDILTFDPVFFSLVNGENIEDSRRFFIIIREVLKYPIKGIVSDLGRGRVFISLIDEIFPEVPHQACVIHFSRYIDMTIPKSKKSVYYKENRILRDTVNNILFAQSFNDAEEIFQRLLSARDYFKAPYHKKVIKSLEKHFNLLTAHFHSPFLIRDNNVTENLIKQLNKKLKQSGGFNSIENTYSFLKLWFIHYRFKVFTNSNEPYRNGKAPLELAMVNINGLDWLDFSQHARHN